MVYPDGNPAKDCTSPLAYYGSLPHPGYGVSGPTKQQKEESYKKLFGKKK